MPSVVVYHKFTYYRGHHHSSLLYLKTAPYSGGFRPSDGGGGGHPHPQIRGGGAVSKKIFAGPSGLSLVLK